MEIAKAVTLGFLALGYTSAANAIVVDGAYDPEYGLAKSVGYDTSAPNGNFGSPTPYNNVVGYSIYLKEQGGSVYGLLRANAAHDPTFNFANLYFDLDPSNGNGSDLGFEITNDRAFIPGAGGPYAENLGLTFAFSADGNGIEFRIPDAFFTGPILGLTYNPGQQFPAPGDKVVLRLSQSFGYSVAGGPTYGDDRLGVVNLEASAVPGPIVGAGLPGLVMAFGGLIAWRRRRNQAATA
jgi:hypothetical protein